MILDAPFMFDAEVIIGRKRNSETIRVRDFLPVIIEEASGTEAELVGTVPAPDRQGKRMQHVELRKLGNTYWRQPVVVMREREDFTPTAVDLESMAKERVSTSAFETPWGGWTYLWKDGVDNLDHLPDLRRIVRTDRDSQIDQIRQRAAKLLLIDGKLFQSAQEPKLELGADVYDGHVGAKIIVHHFGTLDHEYYRADRGEDLIAQIEEQFTALPPHIRQQVLASCPQILRPDLLQFDDEWNALTHAARTFAIAVHPYLPKASRQLLMSYADLRDIIQPGIEKADVNQVVEAIEVTAGLMKNESLGEQPVAKMQAAIDRWRRHEIRSQDEMALAL